MHHWTAMEMAAAIDDGMSPVEIATATVSRIEKLDPSLNVFVHFDPEEVMRQASLAEAEIASNGRRSRLHGVPVGIKDIFDVQGMPTTCHSSLLLGNIASEDADAVKRLRSSGAIILGKVATLEFALGGPSFELPFPPARNPWNRDHHPGGSSSGSGAGIAAGMFPLALGSDTGGSTRNPAAACGIVGLKPTYELVSRGGVFPLAPSFDHIGLMAQNVADVALLLDATANHDCAPSSEPSHSNVDGLSRSMDSLRIGFIRRFHETDLVCDPEVARSLEDAAQILARLGAEVETVDLPSLQHFASVAGVIICAEAWSIHGEWLRRRPEDYCHSTRERIVPGAFLSAEDLVTAQRVRTRLRSEVEAALSQFDLLLCANSMDPPGRFDDHEEMARTYPRHARIPFNVTGHPALAMMSGMSANGLPLSLQLVGRYFDEETLLRAAYAYENVTPWHKMHPAFG